LGRTKLVACEIGIEQLDRSIRVKIDQEYLKKLLEACQASEKPTFDIEDLKAAGLDYNDQQFEFHMKILNDQRFIEQDDGDAGFGLTKGLLDGAGCGAFVSTYGEMKRHSEAG